jgi:protein required for attachment to host cells
MSELVSLKPEVMIEIMRKQLKDELRKELIQELKEEQFEHANLIVDKIIEMLFLTELTSNGK